MTEIWLRKRRTWHAGPIEITVSVPPEIAERLRASALYQRIVKPASRWRHPQTTTVASPGPKPAPAAPLDAEGQALLARIREVDWYHTIDLGHGVVTPGLVDHRRQLPYYALPDSMAGMRVLDVGTFDGFWAFEFERRGAEVVALDVANWSDVDMPQRMRPYAAEFELDRETGAAFALAHEILGSKVKRFESRIYDVDPEVIGTFDLVFVSDILLHLRCPQRAIESLASVCRGEMLVADVFTPMLEGFGDLSFAQYTAPSHTWWLPNANTLRSWMTVAGCESIEEISRFVLDWRVDDPMHKVVLKGRVNADPPWLLAHRDWALASSPKWKSAAEQPA
jgi:tRNA (mo5U34)-methyltransferase